MNTPAKPTPPTPLTPATLRPFVQHLRTLSPKRRVEELVNRPDLSRVLGMLPVQDLHATIQEVGASDCLELFAAAPPKVLQGLMDLSVWRGDRMDPRALASFYAGVFLANPGRALQQALAMDREPFTLFLKLHVRVHDIIEGVDLPHDVGENLTTPDNKLVVEFIDPPGLPQDTTDALGLGDAGRSLSRQATKAIVNGLISRDPAGATQLFDALRWELPSPLEDEAARWRAGRLEDLGFPPREEALVVLAYLDPDVPALREPHRPHAPAPGEDFPDAALALFTAPDERPRESFLMSALANVPPAETEALHRELALLCNRVSVARGVEPGDVEGMHGTVRETRTMVDLGLAYRSGGDVTKAKDVLAHASLQDLYRVGHSLTVKLQRRAVRMLKDLNVDAKEARALLDPPGGLALAALLGRQPLLFAGLTEPGKLEVRPFAMLEDLAVAARSLAESAFRLALGLGVLGISRERLHKASWAGTNLQDASEITLELVLTTALARVAAGGALEPSALSPAELEAARQALAAGPAGVERAGKALAEVVAPKAPLPGARTAPEAAQRAAALAAVLLTRLDEEVRHVPANQPLDGRFVTRALVRLA